MDITEANYDIAWGLLVERYEIKKFIIHAHLKSIFDLPVDNRESHVALRQFLDAFLLNYRALLSLNDNVRYWNAILLYLLCSKLHVNTGRDWEKHTKDELDPTIENFIKFVNNKCQILQTIDNKAGTTRDFRNSGSRSAAHVSTNTAVKHHKCVVCNGTHLIYFFFS